VASFMHILSSMHEALFSAPEDTRPTEHPEDTTEAAQTNTQTSEAAGWQQKERRDDSKDLQAPTKLMNNGTMASRTSRKSLGQATSLPPGLATSQLSNFNVCLFT
jgi:hypothetical protein